MAELQIGNYVQTGTHFVFLFTISMFSKVRKVQFPRQVSVAQFGIFRALSMRSKAKWVLKIDKVISKPTCSDSQIKSVPEKIFLNIVFSLDSSQL